MQVPWNKYLFGAFVKLLVLVTLYLTLHACALRQPNSRSLAVNDDYSSTIDPSSRQGFAAADASIIWTKFSIDMTSGKPTAIYFQNTRKYALHYDFFSAVLHQLLGLPLITSLEFMDITLRNSGRKLLLGTVLTKKPIQLDDSDPRFLIQFVATDRLQKDMAIAAFKFVLTAVESNNTNLQAFYTPPNGHEQSFAAERADFESQGVKTILLNEWQTEDTILAKGWNVGMFHHATGEDLPQLFQAGKISNSSILILDRVPAEIPIVRGIIALNSTTPNSHAVILSRSLGIPFATAKTPELQKRVLSLDGKRGAIGANMSLQVASLEHLSQSEFQDLEKRKLPATPKIEPYSTTQDYLASTDALTPNDISKYGGKSSNFGFLRREIPEHAPAAVAIGFRLWHEFMEQKLPSGESLRHAIDSKLAPHKNFPITDPAKLLKALKEVRELITKTAKFTKEQTDSLMVALKPFHDQGKDRLRFRSSTNVEDTGAINGAGLYDSFTGCYLDDLNNNATVATLCKSPIPSGPPPGKPRSMFDAIKKTFASFYNDNAFIERIRLRVNETQVGMAITVHESTPDEIELANGVMTLVIKRDVFDATIVSNRGADPVTNPIPGVNPEVARVSAFSLSSNGDVRIAQMASGPGIILGERILREESTYLSLFNAARKASLALKKFYGNPDFIELDLEFKLMIDDKAYKNGLQIKQIRTIPIAKAENIAQLPMVPEFAFAEEGLLCTDFGELNPRSDSISIARNRMKVDVSLAAFPRLFLPDSLPRYLISAIDLSYDDLSRDASMSVKFSKATIVPPEDIFYPTLFRHDFVLAGTNGGNAALVVKLDRDPDLPIVTHGTLEVAITRNKSQASVGLGGLSMASRDEVRELLHTCAYLDNVPLPNDPSEFDAILKNSDGKFQLELRKVVYTKSASRAGGASTRVYRVEGATLKGFTTDPILLTGNKGLNFQIGTHGAMMNVTVNPWQASLTPQQKSELSQRDIAFVVQFSSGFGIVKRDGSIETLP